MKISNSIIKELAAIEGIALYRFKEGERHHDVYFELLEMYESIIPGDLIRMAVNSAELLSSE